LKCDILAHWDTIVLDVSLLAKLLVLALKLFLVRCVGALVDPVIVGLERVDAHQLYSRMIHLMAHDGRNQVDGRIVSRCRVGSLQSS